MSHSVSSSCFQLSSLDLVFFLIFVLVVKSETIWRNEIDLEGNSSSFFTCHNFCQPSCFYRHFVFSLLLSLIWLHEDLLKRRTIWRNLIDLEGNRFFTCHNFCQPSCFCPHFVFSLLLSLIWIVQNKNIWKKHLFTLIDNRVPFHKGLRLIASFLNTCTWFSIELPIDIVQLIVTLCEMGPRCWNPNICLTVCNYM